jgi:hypothetical protein
VLFHRPSLDFFDFIKATSKNVIPAKAGIQKPVTLLDSRLRGSDKVIIIRGSLNFKTFNQNFQNFTLPYLPAEDTSPPPKMFLITEELFVSRGSTTAIALHHI